MADLSLDTLESPRFRRVQATGNVTVTLTDGVLVLALSPRITVSATEPTDPAPQVNDLWFQPT